MTAHAALRLEGVARRFGATQILSGVDLSIATGERHALIGPNGAGKSTLFNVIGGALRPDAGTIWLDGIDVTGRRPHVLARAGLGRSFQTTRVFARSTVLENLSCAVWCGLVAARRGYERGLAERMASWTRWWWRSREIDALAARMLGELELEDVAHTAAGALEYGAQRRLDLGIALASGACTLLLDEPTAGMNRGEAARTIEWLRGVSSGKTLLVIEHDMDAVFALADRVSVMVRGRIIATGTPAQIRADAHVREVYLGAGQGGEAS
ncbi:MAG TPA: ABC transporter ATP-binding protein [Trinickia sp.]|jgi:branched-chain amino acid transport system ATP-binding protein|nr:ABC transporter ATP-binding protein [Trinickia sp.]